MVRSGPAAAPVGSTCPWGDRPSEDSNVPQSKPSGKPPRGTCPWGADADSGSSHGRKHVNVGSQNTSPWTGDVRDMDSERLGSVASQSEVKAQRLQAVKLGSAGSGAPKVITPRDVAPGQNIGNVEIGRRAHNPANKNTSPWDGDIGDADSKRHVSMAQKSEVKAQRAQAAVMGCAGGAPRVNNAPASLGLDSAPYQNVAGMEPVAAPSQGFGDETLRVDEDAGGFNPGDEDDDAEERHQLIRQCIEKGLSDEEISDLLDEYHNAKMVENTKRKMAQRQANQPAASLPQASSSVAARRMSKAKEGMSVSFGPSNEEVVGIIREHTPQLSSPRSENAPPMSLAEKREKAKELNLPDVGKFNSNDSRAAYLQGHQQAAAAKDRARVGSGIF